MFALASAKITGIRGCRQTIGSVQTAKGAKMHIDENGIHDVQMLEFVPIVRCKDCKHRKQYECDNIMLGGTRCGVTDDWFCADGERKETENEQS